ncbi:MAG: hypothetical protein JSR60_20590 [Proteobacteria bacterium]|nr:hypothetical protein [Pseudomonadota bacterium]
MKRIRRPIAKAAAATRGALLHALVLATLAAFVFQGYLTSIHIHAVTGGEASFLADLLDGGTPADAGKKVPPKTNPDNCPLCQQFASAGQFVTPAAAAIIVPFLSVSVITLVTGPSTFISSVTHHWRGRGPPQA